MGHFDSAGRSRLSRDIHFEKSPYLPLLSFDRKLSGWRRKMAAPVSPMTGPKPFVFVLMPFSQKFSDIYTFGIKGAAEDVGAYAERIDEQIFNEGILERLFNQINKADSFH
jgi:hypothetical protein